MVFLTLGCAINKAQVNRPDLIDNNKKIFIYGHDDQANINSTVRRNLIELGFDIVENREKAELTIDYNFECHWDVIHYTCHKFNMFATDTRSNEIVFQSKFWADTPLSAKTLINMNFNKLEKELVKTRAQQIKD